MELAIPTDVQRYSLDEYFRMAEASPTKLEFDAGRIVNTAGATYAHNRISTNILVETANFLKGKQYQAMGSDMRVLGADDRYCYPDVTIVCGPPEFDIRDPQKQMTMTNPTVIFEVLSPSTEATDRGEKFLRYINIRSMQGYFLVAQDKPHVTSFVRRPDGSWSVGDVAQGLADSVKMPSMSLLLPMREVYAGVSFGPSDDSSYHPAR